MKCITDESVREEASNWGTAIARKKCDTLPNSQNAKGSLKLRNIWKVTLFN
jgi:hypothetical protein